MAAFDLIKGAVFLLTVLAAVGLGLLVCQIEDVGQLLLDGGDAPGVFAVDDIGDCLGKLQGPLLHNVVVLYDIHCDVVVNIAKHVQIHHIQAALNLDDVLAAHLVAAGVLDDGHLAVQLVKAQVIVDVKASAGLDVVQHDAFL